MAALLRVTNAGARFALWGEDGIIFAQQPRTNGILRSFFTTYAGYFHLLPRIVGAVASVMPLRFTPYVFVGSAALIAATCALMSWRAARALGLSELAAALVGLAVLLLPAGGYEVVDNTTNCQWFVLSATLVFVAAWMAGYQVSLAPCVVLLLIAGLTSPLIGVTLPFVAVVALRRRRPLDLALPATIGLTAAIQFGAGVLSRRDTGPAHPAVSRIVHVYALRAVGGGALGDRFLYVYARALSATAMTVVAAVAVALLAGAIIRRWPLWLPAAFLVVESVMLFVVAAFSRPDSLSPSATTFVEVLGSKVVVQGRYMAVPGLALLVAAIVLIDRRRPAFRSVLTRSSAIGAAALACLSLAANYPIKGAGEPLGTWRTDVAAAAQACHSDRRALVVLPNAPGGPWKVTLTCHQAFKV